MKRRLTLLTLVLFSVSTLMSMPGLAAEYDGYVDAAGNQITPEIEPLTDEEIQRNAAYDNMIETVRTAYEAYLDGEITIDQLQQIEDASYFSVYPEEKDNPLASMKTNPERKEMVEAMKANRQDSSQQVSFEIQPFNLGDGTAKYLPMPYEMQANTWYCGPATAVNIVNGYNGYSRMTQSQAASLLGTTSSSGTDFGSNWYNVLNTSTMGKTYTRAQGYSDWAGDLANKCIGTIWNGRGVALNVVMTPYTTYLPGYSAASGNVYHYVAAYGFESYDPSLRKICYIDPYAEYLGISGAQKVTFQQMALATQTHGIIY